MALPQPVTVPVAERGLGVGRPKGALRLFVEEVAADGLPGAFYRYPEPVVGGGSINLKTRAELGVTVMQRTKTETGERAPEKKCWIYVRRDVAGTVIA